MPIVTPPVKIFPTPPTCFSCGSKFYRHGKRRRHVITQEKIWYFVRRLRCSGCGVTRTLLMDNMLPHKHYAAPEIEQVLHEHEDPTAQPNECGAEESTIRRWLQEFPPKLNELAVFFEALTDTIRIHLVLPLQRLNNALKLLPHPPPKHIRLAWAFFRSKFNPVHVE
jgi:transposase-like protein